MFIKFRFDFSSKKIFLQNRITYYRTILKLRNSFPLLKIITVHFCTNFCILFLFEWNLSLLYFRSSSINNNRNTSASAYTRSTPNYSTTAQPQQHQALQHPSQRHPVTTSGGNNTTTDTAITTAAIKTTSQSSSHQQRHHNSTATLFNSSSHRPYHHQSPQPAQPHHLPYQQHIHSPHHPTSSPVVSGNIISPISTQLSHTQPVHTTITRTGVLCCPSLRWPTHF